MLGVYLLFLGLDPLHWCLEWLILSNHLDFHSNVTSIKRTSQTLLFMAASKMASHCHSLQRKKGSNFQVHHKEKNLPQFIFSPLLCVGVSFLISHSQKFMAPSKISRRNSHIVSQVKIHILNSSCHLSVINIVTKEASHNYITSSVFSLLASAFLYYHACYL